MTQNISRHRRLFAALLFIPIWIGGDAAAQVPPASDVGAQASTATAAPEPSPAPLEATSPAIQYRRYKAAVFRWLREHVDLLYQPGPERGAIVIDPRSLPFDIEPGGEGTVPTADDELLALAQLTGWVEANLRSAGYPPSLYTPPLREYEARTAGEIERRHRAGASVVALHSGIEPTIRAIELARQASNPNLPALRLPGYIPMAGGRPTVFRASPQNGRVWILSRFRFQACQAQQIPDPHDRARCPGWRQVDGTTAIPLSGIYHYQVAWPNGASDRGERTVPAGARQTLYLTVP